MFFSAVASDARIMPPHFIKAGTKINTSESVKILKEVLMPWIKNITIISELYSSNTRHLLMYVQDLLIRELPISVAQDVWPSSSPDLNPCDYWLWSKVEKVSNNDAHTRIGSLKSAIKRGFWSISREHTVNACKSFRRRIQFVIDAGESHIE